MTKKSECVERIVYAQISLKDLKFPSIITLSPCCFIHVVILVNHSLLKASQLLEDEE